MYLPPRNAKKAFANGKKASLPTQESEVVIVELCVFVCMEEVEGGGGGGSGWKRGEGSVSRFLLSLSHTLSLSLFTPTPSLSLFADSITGEQLGESTSKDMMVTEEAESQQSRVYNLPP